MKYQMYIWWAVCIRYGHVHAWWTSIRHGHKYMVVSMFDGLAYAMVMCMLGKLAHPMFM